MPAQKLSYRATENIRPGSVIEYETEMPQYIGHRTARALAFVVRIEWANRYSRSRFHVITHKGEYCIIDLHAITWIVAI